MKEVQFIRKNKEKWLIAEKILKKEIKSPDTIVEAYEGLSADLAFVLTHYPNSDLADYLNCLTLRLHNRIYGKRKHKLSSLVRFFSHDVPLEMYRNRKFMLISIVIFAISTAVGVLSQYNLADETTILGKEYVEMSLKNIEKGAPMAVYGSGRAYESFWFIALNNIWVAVLSFISGVLTCFYTGFIMVKNGVMLGAFITLGVASRSGRDFEHHNIGRRRTGPWLWLALSGLLSAHHIVRYGRAQQRKDCGCARSVLLLRIVYRELHNTVVRQGYGSASKPCHYLRNYGSHLTLFCISTCKST